VSRECGSCSACCKLLAISAERAPEVAKPAGVLCRHCTSPGCGIYQRRPALCRDFACLWLLDEKLGPEWFPPTSGMILVWQEPSSLFVIVDPDRPDAWRKQPYKADIERMSRWGARAPEPFEVRVVTPDEGMK
jgi:uncharacterized protein